MSKSITFTALDIGTSSIKGICATKDLKSGDIDVSAKVEHPQTGPCCFGVRNGEVIKPDPVSKMIAKVKDDLIKKTDLKIKEVLVNIGGNHLFSVASQGLISVSRADQKISNEDVQRVLKAAEAVNLPSNKEVIDVFPKEYIIDGESVKDPLGLEGIRLEAKVLLACVFSPILEHLYEAVEGADLQIIDILLSPLAVSRAVLTGEQKELGVLLVDIGAGTTSIAMFEKGDLVDFSVFPIGSSNITNDIAIGLRTEIQTAEKIKQEYATLKTSTKRGKKDKIELPEKSLSFSSRYLRNIVESRMGDIFLQIQRSLKKMSSGEPLPGGVVLTGGGANLPGLVEFTKQKLKLPCRRGIPYGIPNIEDPSFATCCGLLLSAFDAGEEELIGEGMGRKIRGGFKKIFKAFLP